MAVVLCSKRAFDDLDRLAESVESMSSNAISTLRRVLRCIAMLEQHPQLGRVQSHGLRELVISQGKSGYLALYRYDLRRDLVRVLRLRHQREAGYRF